MRISFSFSLSFCCVVGMWYYVSALCSHDIMTYAFIVLHSRHVFVLCCTSGIGVWVVLYTGCMCMHFVTLHVMCGWMSSDVHFAHICTYTRCRCRCMWCISSIGAYGAWCCMVCVVVCVWCTLHLCAPGGGEGIGCLMRVANDLVCVQKNKGRSKDWWRISIGIVFQFYYEYDLWLWSMMITCDLWFWFMMVTCDLWFWSMMVMFWTNLMWCSYTRC